MKTILTLTVGEFHFVDDMFLLALMIMGIFSFIFFKSSFLLPSSSWSRQRVSLDLAGMVTIVTCLCYFWLNRSWNNAFELAGNSYAASGHLFREDYRYVTWFLTAPLLLAAFITALPLDSQKWRFFLPRFIIAAMTMIFFGYLGKNYGEIHNTFLSLVSYLLAASAFSYIIFFLWKKVPQALAGSTEAVYQLFLKARRFLIISGLMYPLIGLFSSFSYFASSRGVVSNITAYTLMDIISQCGLGLFIYGLAVAQQPSKVS